MILVPAPESLNAWETLQRTLRRFQKGPRAPYWADQSGTDITISEPWKTLDFKWLSLKTEPVQCWSEGAKEIRGRTSDTGEAGDPGLSRVTVRYAPADLPSRRLHQQNAVIFADSAEILESTLWLIPAVPTAEILGKPMQGIPVHILQSEMFGTGSEGGYGRLDFWDREPEPKKKPHRPPPEEQETPEDPTTPQAMAEMLLELAERTSESLEETGTATTTLLDKLTATAAKLSQSLHPSSNDYAWHDRPSFDEDLPF